MLKGHLSQLGYEVPSTTWSLQNPIADDRENTARVLDPVDMHRNENRNGGSQHYGHVHGVFDG